VNTQPLKSKVRKRPKPLQQCCYTYWDFDPIYFYTLTLPPGLYFFTRASKQSDFGLPGTPWGATMAKVGQGFRGGSQGRPGGIAAAICPILGVRKQEGSSGALWVLQCRALSKVNLGSARATGGAPKVGQTGSLHCLQEAGPS